MRDDKKWRMTSIWIIKHIFFFSTAFFLLETSCQRFIISLDAIFCWDLCLGSGSSWSGLFLLLYCQDQLVLSEWRFRTFLKFVSIFSDAKSRQIFRTFVFAIEVRAIRQCHRSGVADFSPKQMTSNPTLRTRTRGFFSFLEILSFSTQTKRRLHYSLYRYSINFLFRHPNPENSINNFHPRKLCVSILPLAINDWWCKAQ